MQSTRFKKVLLALLFAIAVYAVMVLTLRWLGLENVQHWVKSAGIWSPILFVVVCAASLIAAPLSGSSLYIVGGALFGKEIGLLLGYLASLLGCSANFWISRKFGRKVAARFIGKSSLAELDKSTDKLKGHHEIAYMILMMPLSQDIVSYAVGLTQVKYRNFFVALAISAIGIVAAYIYIGTSVLEALL